MKLASCEGKENTYFITDEEVFYQMEVVLIRCLQFYASWSLRKSQEMFVSGEGLRRN